MRGYMTSPEILGIPDKMDPLSTKDKPATLKVFQDLTAVVDSVGICLFTTFGQSMEQIGPMIRTCTGWDLDDDEIMKIGDRIWTMEKMYNLGEGFTKKDDQLPPRLTQEPVPKGPAKGQVSHVPEMLPEYYKLRGYDNEGVPTDEKLKELGLK